MVPGGGMDRRVTLFQVLLEHTGQQRLVRVGQGGRRLRKVICDLAEQGGLLVFVLFLAAPGQVGAQGGQGPGGQKLQVVLLQRRRGLDVLGGLGRFFRPEHQLGRAAKRAGPAVGQAVKGRPLDGFVVDVAADGADVTHGFTPPLA